MKFKRTTYELLFDGQAQTGIRTAVEARRRVRQLVARGFRVICDKVKQTPSTNATERVFRNDPQYPLNTLKV